MLVAIDVEASPEELAAVRRAMSDFGFETDVSASYSRKSAGDALPWALLITGVPWHAFVKRFAEHAAADAYEALTSWLRRIREARGNRDEGSVLVIDEETQVWIVIPATLPDEAIEELRLFDPAIHGGPMGHITYDAGTGEWTKPE
jgi:hypothetical protein